MYWHGMGIGLEDVGNMEGMGGGTDQNGGAQVEFVEELGDEDVDLEHVLLVVGLHLLEHIHEPLKVLVCGADPEEVDLKVQGQMGISMGLYIWFGEGNHLSALDAAVVARCPLQHQIHEGGRVRGDADATADHDDHLVVVPLLTGMDHSFMYCHQRHT
jgi:hypothetical protein